MKFKIGDRIRVKEDIDFTRIKKGTTGTILDFNGVSFIDVEFDEYIDGHDCRGMGKAGYCWVCETEEIEKISEKELRNQKKLRVGDWVRFVKNVEHNKTGSYKFILGKKGVIMGIEDFNGYITYKVKIEGYANVCANDRLYRLRDFEVEQVKEKNIDSGKDYDKGEIMEILRIYKERKVRDAENLATKNIDNLLDDNKDYSAYVNAATSLGMEKDRDAIIDKLLDNNADFKKKYDEIMAKCTNVKGVLADYIAEVEAQLEICETYDQKIAVLKTYGIIGDDGRINA